MKSKKISRDNLKLLINLKSLFHHASMHVRGKTVTDRMIAILNLDNCVEWLLKILVNHFDIDGIGKEDSTLMLMGKIDKYLSEHKIGSLPFRLQIEDLHTMRNMIQHGQVFPPEEVEKRNNLVYKFISKISDKFLLVKFEHVSLAELIENEEIKKIVADAEKYKEKNRMMFVVKLRDAFDLACLFEEQKYYRSLSSVIGMKIDNVDKDFTYLLDEYEKNFRILALGINFKEYTQYENILSYVPHEYQIDWRGNSVLQGDFSDEQINFVYNFVVNSIIDFQSINYLDDRANLVKITDTYKYYDSYDGQELPNDSAKLDLTGMAYIFSNQNETSYNAEKQYITHNSYLNFPKFVPGQIVVHECKRWKNGVLTYRAKRKLKIIGLKFRAVRNDPGIWEYIIGYEEVKNSRENFIG